MQKTLQNCSGYKLLLLIAFFLSTDSCKQPEQVPQVSLAQKRAEDATRNNLAVTGVGNILFEKKFQPNSSSQLVSKIAYKGDTVAYYAKIDANSRLEYIHTAVLSKKNNTEQFVIEIYPNEYKSRMYSITNGKKSRLVTEIINYSQDVRQISLLNMDWTTGISKTVESTLLDKDVVKSSFSSGRLAAPNDIWNCDKPQSTAAGDISKITDNYLEYFSCGPAWDSYPVLAVIKKVVISGIDKLNKLEAFKDQVTDLEQYKQAYGEFIEYRAATKDKLKELASDQVENMKSKLSALEELYNKNNTLVEVLLIPFGPTSVYAYDENKHNAVRLDFQLVDKAQKKPYTDKVVFIDIRYFIPNTDKYVFEETQSQSAKDGIVSFTLDPLKQLPADQEYVALEARYAFSHVNWERYEKQQITLRYIEPQLVTINNQVLPPTVDFMDNETKLFKLLITNGRQEKAPDYSKLSIGSNTNSNITIGMVPQSNGFGVKLTTTDRDSSPQATSFDIKYRGKLVQKVAARLQLSVPTKVEMISGSNQPFEPGKLLPKPLQVKVTDQSGKGVEKAEVEWSVLSGGGQLSASKTVTDALGMAEVKWTLGNTTTNQEVQAIVKKKDGSILAGSPIKFIASQNLVLGKWIVTEYYAEEESYPWKEDKEELGRAWVFSQNTVLRQYKNYEDDDEADFYRIDNDKKIIELYHPSDPEFSFKYNVILLDSNFMQLESLFYYENGRRFIRERIKFKR